MPHPIFIQGKSVTVSSRRAYDDRGWAVAAYVAGLAPFLLFDRTRSVESRRRAADATDLFLTCSLVLFVVGEVLVRSVESVVLILLATLPVGCWSFAMTIVGAIHAWRGSEWTTPLTLPLARKWFARRIKRAA